MILLDLMIALTIAMSVFALLLTLKPGRLFKFGKWPFFLGFTIVINFFTTIAACIIIVLQGNSGSGSAGHIIEILGGLMTSGHYALDLAVFIFLMGYGLFFILNEVNKVVCVTTLFLTSWAGRMGAGSAAMIPVWLLSIATRRAVTNHE